MCLQSTLFQLINKKKTSKLQCTRGFRRERKKKVLKHNPSLYKPSINSLATSSLSRKADCLETVRL